MERIASLRIPWTTVCGRLFCWWCSAQMDGWIPHVCICMHVHHTNTCARTHTHTDTHIPVCSSSSWTLPWIQTKCGMRTFGKVAEHHIGILGFSAFFLEQVESDGDSQPVHLIHSDQPAGETAVHTRTAWVPCRCLAV